MSHHRRFWDGLLVALEESLAAFSGVNPDLIDASDNDSQNLSPGWWQIRLFGTDIGARHERPKFGNTIKNNQ